MPKIKGGYLEITWAEQVHTDRCKEQKIPVPKGYCGWYILRAIFVTLLLMYPTITLTFFDKHITLLAYVELRVTQNP